MYVCVWNYSEGHPYLQDRIRVLVSLLGGGEVNQKWSEWNVHDCCHNVDFFFLLDVFFLAKQKLHLCIDGATQVNFIKS